MAAKKKAEILVTPKVVAAYAWVHKEDEKYGKYKITGIFDKDNAEHKEFLQKLAKVAGKDKIKDGDNPINGKTGKKKEVKEEHRGKWLVNFSSKYKPDTRDAKKNSLPDGTFIYSGDVVRIAFVVREYDDGVALSLAAVQLIEKRNTGRSYGDLFDEEDGFDGGSSGSQGGDDFDDEDSDNKDGDDFDDDLDL